MISRCSREGDENIKEKYKISFGLQYDAWEMAIQMPDWVEYASEAEAHKISGDTTVFALLTANAIFYFMRECPQDTSE